MVGLTLEEQLIQINTAISKIENGAQEYKFRDRTIRRADLAVLYKERREIERRVAEQANGGDSVVAAFYR